MNTDCLGEAWKEGRDRWHMLRKWLARRGHTCKRDSIYNLEEGKSQGLTSDFTEFYSVSLVLVSLPTMSRKTEVKA